MSRISADEAGGPNVVAFLDAIACSELGPALLRLSDDGYNVLVGSTPTKPLLFSSYATHPNVFNSALRSTAAGRYQELFRNWVAYQPLLRLPDFGPLSQDRLALQQLKEARAIVSIQQGRVTQAVMLCAHLWASLPGADYGQHEQELAQIVDWFRAAGGTLA